MFTRASVHWAERMVATSSSNGLRWTSAQTDSGYIALRPRTISAACRFRLGEGRSARGMASGSGFSRTNHQGRLAARADRTTIRSADLGASPGGGVWRGRRSGSHRGQGLEAVPAARGRPVPERGPAAAHLRGTVQADDGGRPGLGPAGDDCLAPARGRMEGQGLAEVRGVWLRRADLEIRTARGRPVQLPPARPPAGPADPRGAQRVDVSGLRIRSGRRPGDRGGRARSQKAELLRLFRAFLEPHGESTRTWRRSSRRRCPPGPWPISSHTLCRCRSRPSSASSRSVKSRFASMTSAPGSGPPSRVMSGSPPSADFPPPFSAN